MRLQGIILTIVVGCAVVWWWIVSASFVDPVFVPGDCIGTRPKNDGHKEAWQKPAPVNAEYRIEAVGEAHYLLRHALKLNPRVIYDVPRFSAFVYIDSVYMKVECPSFLESLPLAYPEQG